MVARCTPSCETRDLKILSCIPFIGLEGLALCCGNGLKARMQTILISLEYDHFLKDWEEKTKLDYAFITSPSLMIVVGEK